MHSALFFNYLISNVNKCICCDRLVCFTSPTSKRICHSHKPCWMIYSKKCPRPLRQSHAISFRSNRWTLRYCCWWFRLYLYEVFVGLRLFSLVMWATDSKGAPHYDKRYSFSNFFAESFDQNKFDDFLLIMKWSDLNSVASKIKADEQKTKTIINNQRYFCNENFRLGKNKTIRQHSKQLEITSSCSYSGKKERKGQERREGNMKNSTGHKGGWCSRKFIYSRIP